MPMEKPEHFGTEAGGGKSMEYCCFCFKNGKFAWEGTLGQMIEKLVAMAPKMGMTEEAARAMANKNLPKLRRWKKN